MLERKRPILLTGVNGQVGGALLPMLQRLGDVVSPTRSDLDLTDPAAIRRFVREVRPSWIVNPAAYTAVDKAETDRETAFAVNAEAPTALGEESAKIGAPVLHFSTDYVFSGDGTTAWKEEDPTRPLGVYGASKLAGERGLASSGASHLIFRTSWVYGATGHNFLRTILRLARERAELKIVSDQYGAPTSSRELARLTCYCIDRTERLSCKINGSICEALEPAAGVYHACNAGETTWYGFASRFVQMAQSAEPAQSFAKLIPIGSAEYPTPAARPSNSRLNCNKLSAKLGFTLPSWQDSLIEVMAELTAQTTQP